MGYKVIIVKENELEEKVLNDCSEEGKVIFCVLVVIVMGYVDYGKMLIFDYICLVKVVFGEVGGIM